MKHLKPSVILLPCHSLDDFPVYHKGEDAASLLASWTALWHPLLLVATQSLPTWQRVEDPPEDCHERLVVVPSVGRGALPTGFAARVAEQGGWLVQGESDRQAILDQTLKIVDSATTVSESWVPDFLALGYAFLQVQLLTRHMRYASNLDQIHFEQQVLKAAQAALDHDAPRVEQGLQQCFDILTEEREHFYPVDALLLDLVVLPHEVDAQSLAPQLAAEHPVNVQASGELLARWAQDETLGTAMQSAFAEERWQLIGGESVETRAPLLAQESLLGQLKSGLAQYQEAVGTRPPVFGRRRFGLSWAYPQLLLRTGFRGALHATLDDGRFPEGLGLKTRWEGREGAVIDAFAKIPFDATLPETYLTLAIKLGEMLDSDHAAGLCLVHWPGTPSPFFKDLVRVHHYCGAIGKFVSFQQFLSDMNDPGISDRFSPDQYRSPYLQQAVIASQTNPISSRVDYWRAQHQLNALSGLTVLGNLVQQRVEAETEIDWPAWQHQTDRLDEPTSASHAVSTADSASATERLGQATTAAATRLGRLLGSGSGATGLLVVNPFNTVRRVGLRLDGNLPRPKCERPIYAADRTGETLYVVVDVPPMGYVWLPDSGKDHGSRSGPPLADEYLLRNEFFETTIDRHTGGIRTYHEYNIRGNRLSQQLALRLAEPVGEHAYSLMQAESIETRLANAACAEIVSRGRLVHPEGERELARYEQVLRVWRGIRVLDIDIHLEPHEALRNDPWNSYFCQRLVWRDQAADLYRDVNEVRKIGSNKRLEASQFVEIEMDPRRTTLLTGGLTFHRRRGLNQLDTLLQVQGEQATDFRLGLGLDLTYPTQAARQFASDVALVPGVPCPAAGPSGWLIHLDARNVMATHWETCHDDQGRATGFRVRLLETMGRPVEAHLACAQPIRRARKIDFLGEPLEDCPIEKDRVSIALELNELVEVEVEWDA